MNWKVTPLYNQTHLREEPMTLLCMYSTIATELIILSLISLQSFMVTEPQSPGTDEVQQYLSHQPTNPGPSAPPETMSSSIPAAPPPTPVPPPSLPPDDPSSSLPPPPSRLPPINPPPHNKVCT